jgi:hypothetical protein
MVMPKLLMSRMSSQEKLDYLYNKLIKEYNSLKTKPILCGTIDCRIYKCERGCCRDCAKYTGFFDISIKDASYEHHKQEKEEQLNVLKQKYGFDFELGFFKPRIGCILPIKERSMTCMEYFCYDMYMKTSPSTIPKIVALCHKIRRIKTKMGFIY